MDGLFPPAKAEHELFVGNPGLRLYAEKITTEYNRWAAAYREATADHMNLVDEGVAAFMCNAINASVSKSQHEDVRRYFQLHACFD